MKTSEEHWVPIYPHLIEQGLLEFADREDNTTTLFFLIARQRIPHRINPTYTSVGNKLAEGETTACELDPSDFSILRRADHQARCPAASLLSGFVCR